MMNGIIPLWKEKGMTSHDCVFKMRKLLHTKKVGHAGTLDPNVEGVLPICVGRATKLADLLHEEPKVYMGEICLGLATETEDADGAVVAQKEVNTPPTAAEVDAMMQSMLGQQVQVPPLYSAVKVNGKRLYEYARKQEEVERPQRNIEIFEFKRVSPIEYETESKTAKWRFTVRCSKGTYIRTLAVDLGANLGYPAHMSYLVRLQSGGFHSGEALRLSEIAAAIDKREEHFIYPMTRVVATWPKRQLTATEAKKVRNGAPLLKLPEERALQKIALYEEEHLLALYQSAPQANQWRCSIMIQINQGE